MLKELSEDLSSIKHIQSETKDTLIEMKKNLQGNNSRVDETETWINDLEHKEVRNNQSEQQEEKRIQKNEDSVRSLQFTSRIPTFSSWACQKGKRKSKKLEIYLKK